MKNQGKAAASVAAIFALVVFAGCGSSGDSDSQSTADAAAESAQAAQEQVDQLQQEIDQQKADFAKKQAKLAKQARQIRNQKASQARKVKAQVRRAQAAAKAKAADAAAAAAAAGPPDVVGLTLPAARKALKSAGYSADPSNTDTAFGIVIESNYTICTQDEPKGNIVPVSAQKYGC